MRVSKLLCAYTRPVFAYYSGFTLQTTGQDLLFCASLLEFRVLKLLAFPLSSLIDALCGLSKAFPGVFDLVKEGFSFPIPICVREFLYTLGLFRIVRLWYLDASLMFLAYRQSAEIDYWDARCVSWFPYNGITADVLSTQEPPAPTKKRDRRGVLITRTLWRVDASYSLFKRTTLNYTQEWERLALSNMNVMTTKFIVMMEMKIRINQLSRWHPISVVHKFRTSRYVCVTSYPSSL